MTTNVIAEAERLTEPGRVYEPSAEKAVHAAATEINARGGPTTEGEARICRQAERLRLYTPSTDPKPAVSPERAARKAAEKAEVERLQLLHDAALEALALARAREERATTPEESSRLHTETRNAEAAHASERDSLERSIARFNTT
jgi:hypothetical protein